MTRWPRSACTFTTGAAKEFSRATRNRKPVAISVASTCGDAVRYELVIGEGARNH